MGINVLSLFDGISAGMVALERANVPVDRYYSSEIDPYAILFLRKTIQTSYSLEMFRIGKIGIYQELIY